MLFGKKKVKDQKTHKKPVDEPAYHYTEYSGLKTNNKETMEPVVEENGLAFAMISPSLQQDRDMQIAAIKNSWMAFKLLPDNAKKNEEIKTIWVNHAYSGHEGQTPLQERLAVMKAMVESQVAKEAKENKYTSNDTDEDSQRAQRAERQASDLNRPETDQEKENRLRYKPVDELTEDEAAWLFERFTGKKLNNIGQSQSTSNDREV